MLFLCSLIFSVRSVSGAAPPWSECSQCLPPPLSRATGHRATMLGTRSHYAGDIGVSERGRDTRRLVTIAWSRGQLITRPAAAQPPCRSKYFLMVTRKYFSCSPSHREPSVCRHPQLPSNIQHSICHIEYYSLFSLHLQHKNVPALSLQFCEASA